MGGKSSSSSSQSNTTITTDRRIAATDSAIVNAGDGSIVVESLDRELIERVMSSALGFAADEGAGSRELAGRALDEAFDFGGEALGTVSEVHKGAMDAIVDAQNQAFTLTEAALNHAKDEGLQGFNSLLKAGTAIGVVLAIAWGLRGK